MKAKKVTNREKRALEAEYRKVEILMSYEEIIANEADLTPLIEAWDIHQDAGDRIEKLKTSIDVFNAIELIFGINGETSLTVHTMLQHGRIQKAHEFNVNYKAKQDCLREAGLV